MKRYQINFALSSVSGNFEDTFRKIVGGSSSSCLYGRSPVRKLGLQCKMNSSMSSITITTSKVKQWLCIGLMEVTRSHDQISAVLGYQNHYVRAQDILFPFASVNSAVE